MPRATLATSGPLSLGLDGIVRLDAGDDREDLGHVEDGSEVGEHWRDLQRLERIWSDYTGGAWGPSDRLAESIKEDLLR